MGNYSEEALKAKAEGDVALNAAKLSAEAAKQADRKSVV